MKPAILIVDDEPTILNAFSRYLKKSGYAIATSSSLAAARTSLASRSFDAVILDMVLPDGNSIDLIDHIKQAYPHTSVVVVTGRGDIRVAVDAMRRGADNFLTKPVNMEELDVFLQKSIELSILRKKAMNRERLGRKFEPWFGESIAMKKVVEVAEVASETDTPVLIQGETGSGKGVLARWIHDRSPRSAATFVDVNCSSLRGELLASELFGHVRGAFTSAVQDRQGLIEVADGGTLFLDEIGDMDLSVQAQFLKVVEEKSYRRLGEATPRRSVFRLICATNRDLNVECDEGRFRRDLYFRICTLPVVMPPLRTRTEDLPGLLRYMLGALGSPGVRVGADVMELLTSNPWPGNVREFRGVLERALLFARGKEFLLPEHFPGLDVSKPGVRTRGHNLDRVVEERIKEVLMSTNNDMQKAASSLGISRTTLYRKLKKIKDTGVR